MPRWKKNESAAAERRVLIAAYDSDGALADPRHTFSGTNEKLVDPSTGVFAVPGGALANATKPLSVTAFTFTTTHASELVNKTAHGLRTGDGPFQLTTTTTLPAGYSLATDYWWIWLSANAGQWASSLANALLGTPVAITTDGTGTHTATATASAKRLVDGHWTYTASQAEINIDGYFAVRLEKEATTGASSNYQETAGVVTLTGTGFLPRHVGRRITIAGAANTLNNGDFTIASYVSATAITFANADAIDEVLAMTFTIDDAVKPVTMNVDIYTPEMDEISEDSSTYGDAVRLLVAIVFGKGSDFTTDTTIWKSMDGATTRATHTYDASARLTAVKGTLTP